MGSCNIFFSKYCSSKIPWSLFWYMQRTCTYYKFIWNMSAERTLISATSDAMDNFTDKLVQEKTNKWRFINTQKKANFEIESKNDSSVQMCDADFDVKSIDKLMTNAIHSKQLQLITSALHFSRRTSYCPPSELLLEAATMFSRCGNKSGIQAIQLLCETLNKNEYSNQAEYKHYIAEATWINGNVEDALVILADVYKHHASLRRKIRNMTKFLFAECISNRSEASVVMITNFAKIFATEYGDFYFLSYLWQLCFLSEWFSDQEMANRLLEQYENLRTAIINKIQILSVIALKRDNTEMVHRLLEVTLHYEMKQQYTLLLRTLFDYKCDRRDLKGCSAIIASSLELNTTLTAEQHNKFLALLLDYQCRNKQLLRKTQDYSHKSLKVPSFQLKF